MTSQSAFSIERQLLVKADVDSFLLQLAGPHKLPSLAGDSALVESNGVEIRMSSPGQRRVGILPLRMNRPPFSFSGFSVMEK